MNSTPQTISIASNIIAIAVWLLAVYVIYRRNLQNLNACKNSRKVSPNIRRLAVSWFFCSMLFLFPLICIVWFLSRKFPVTGALTLLFLFMSVVPSVLPYYTVAVFKSRINGATQWGWRWKRTEIAFNEIDVSKSSNQRLGNAFGIRVFHSISGKKILTLGLTDQQISNILQSAHETE